MKFKDLVIGDRFISAENLKNLQKGDRVIVLIKTSASAANMVFSGEEHYNFLDHRHLLDEDPEVIPLLL